METKKGKLICTSASCRYKPKRTTYSNGIKLTNGVDDSYMYEANSTDDPKPCVHCGSETTFEPYDFDSIALAKYSAQSNDAKRESLIKRRDDFNKSREGRAMRAKAEYYQGVGPAHDKPKKGKKR